MRISRLAFASKNLGSVKYAGDFISQKFAFWRMEPAEVAHLTSQIEHRLLKNERLAEKPMYW